MMLILLKNKTKYNVIKKVIIQEVLVKAIGCLGVTHFATKVGKLWEMWYNTILVF
ncbi:hypothetical protein QMM58_08035 [Clostridioides difficile]|nr:hypothetical protein [Clostridioides difficile]